MISADRPASQGDPVAFALLASGCHGVPFLTVSGSRLRSSNLHAKLFSSPDAWFYLSCSLCFWSSAHSAGVAGTSCQCVPG